MRLRLINRAVCEKCPVANEADSLQTSKWRDVLQIIAGMDTQPRYSVSLSDLIAQRDQPSWAL